MRFTRNQRVTAQEKTSKSRRIPQKRKKYEACCSKTGGRWYFVQPLHYCSLARGIRSIESFDWTGGCRLRTLSYDQNGRDPVLLSSVPSDANVS